MSTSYPNNQYHPEDLLGAHALDALDGEEAALAEGHLEDCSQCREAVAELQRATTRLGMSVARREAPGGLLTKVMRALEPAAPPPTPIKDSRRASFWSWPRAINILAPVAAVVVVALFSVSVVFNIRISDRMEGLERENAALTAQVAQSAQLESQAAEQVAETMQQLRATNYWLANPTNHSLALEPPGGSGASRGVLMVSSDGRQAMLLVSGMPEASPSSYEVWLMRPGHRSRAGEVEVDEGGWGTAVLVPGESVFGFDKVELTSEMAPGALPGPDDMVLQAKIPSSQQSPMLTLHEFR